MPIVESDVSMPLADRLSTEASAAGIPAHLLRLDLGVVVAGGRSLAALTIGVQVPRRSPLAWTPGRGCQRLTAEVGAAVHIRRSRGRVGVSARQLDGCVIDAEVTG